MKINKKGFSMVELLGVITLLGIVALVCVPAVSNLLQKARKEYYAAIEQDAKASGMDYFSDHKDLLPDEIGKTAIIYVGDQTGSKDSLVGLSYIDEVKDRKENTCGYFKNEKEKFSYVMVTRIAKDNKNSTESNFSYTACMSCPKDNYNTNEKEYEYCKSSYLPNYNRYLKTPNNYYLQISDYDYKQTKLSRMKNGNDSTYDYFELRKAGVRNNDGIPQVENSKVITVMPSHIDLMIDDKIVSDIISTNKSNAFDDLVNKLSLKMGNVNFEDYLKSHTVKLKLTYSYTYTYQNKETATRIGYTYITLIKEMAEDAETVSINSYYINDNTKYYSSIAKTNAKTEYLYSYNVNHNNIDAKYASLLKDKILTNVTTYTNAEDLPSVNRGVKVNFQSVGTSLFECSLDNTIWYPCESGEKYQPTNATQIHDIYVRAINMYGKRGPVNRYPINIDTRSTTLTVKMNQPTGNDDWYKENVTMTGTVENAEVTQYCKVTGSKKDCDPLSEGIPTNQPTKFTENHTSDTPKITYCFQSITKSGNISNKNCSTFKKDTAAPIVDNNIGYKVFNILNTPEIGNIESNTDGTVKITGSGTSATITWTNKQNILGITYILMAYDGNNDINSMTMTTTYSDNTKHIDAETASNSKPEIDYIFDVDNTKTVSKIDLRFTCKSNNCIDQVRYINYTGLNIFSSRKMGIKNNYGNLYRARGTCTDFTSGCAIIQISDDDGKTYKDLESKSSFFEDLYSNKKYRIKAVDVAGNETISDTISTPMNLNIN